MEEVDDPGQLAVGTVRLNWGGVLADEHAAARPAYVGVASMVVQGRPGFVRVRTPYVRDEDVARVCQAAASLTRDPATLLPETLRMALYSPGIEPSAASERGEDKSAEAVAQMTVRDDEDVA